MMVVFWLWLGFTVLMALAAWEADGHKRNRRR
jgi:hypothetical protein